ncbi:DNA-binding transcriptional regulator, LysR family [Pseudonocardia thermophila]|jgi:Transcriptional regulator|uniref:DNA-binding transcriptional regulator, LysR family n=1 Tax=Pseudonocardia thermophila TaxID=1848 RepID=A0A1M6RKH5_PSETH|nr:LysR substrate-binding domain-containing protein [Pseudonocardia thermophila]SHK32963.1 DNA-binding transcriptional regulator, LysR family [Pseudonocardia thermophila]
MDVHRARAFLAVAEELHFGRAAARLRMAQPPLSRMIRAIEAELGAPLFERGPRHVALTPLGEALIEPARSLVMQSERIVEIARRMRRGESGRVRLGFSGASVYALVGALVRRAREDYPGLTLELRGSHLSEPGLERMLAGGLDAVVGRWDRLPDEVDSLVLAQEELLVALPAEHRLAVAEALRPGELADEAWIALPGGRGATLSNRLHLLGTLGRFVPRIVDTAVDSPTQLLMVDSGAGIALVFSGVSAAIPVHDVVFRPLDPGLGPVEVRLAWRRADPNPALARLVELAARMS